MSIEEHDTFAEAYVAGLEAIFDRGRAVNGVQDASSVGSSFGQRPRPTLELTSFAFRVRDPLSCLIDCVPRQTDLGYIAGQWLWVMAGSDSLDRISYYNSAGRPFSEDGRRLPGAFGARMRRNAGDQLLSVLDLLRRDPSSRRAVIVFAEAADARQPTRDFPCALATQLMIRGGRLEAVTTMRSQSALMVLPYDASLFMTLHVWTAAVLGIEPGPHHWVANSFHVYADEIDLAHEVLAHPPTPRSLPSRISDPESTLRVLEVFEESLRTAVATGTRLSATVPLPPVLGDEAEFHGWFAGALRVHARRREGGTTRRSASTT
jgi:thymidylate synthase